MVEVRKKRSKKVRHEQVAEDFKSWLDNNPKAPPHRQVKTFDAICDAAYEAQQTFGNSGKVLVVKSELESSRSSSR